MYTDQCDYADSPFRNDHHKHIITKDLRIIKNKKLGKLLKGPNYQEPQTIKISNALIETITALDTCMETMTLKINYTTLNFKPWKK